MAAMASTRSYDMTKRAKRAARTGERILDVTEELLRSAAISDVTLQAIADGAGVTVQTVLRHMGSREGCFAAVGERVSERVRAQRGRSAPGDVTAAIADLVAHYEAEGRLVLNLLSQEPSGEPMAVEAAAAGRSYHRSWVERCFGPKLDKPSEQTIDALVAATDLYVWKLLRLDLGRSTEEAEAIIARMARALLEVA